MKRIMILLLCTAWIGSSAQSIYRARDYTGPTATAYIPISWDSLGYLKLSRLSLSQLASLATSGGLTSADTAAMLANYRTGVISSVKYTDTASMLTNYRIGTIARVKYTDTATMLTPYAKTFQIPTNNNQLTNGSAYITAAAISGKVNYTDTSGMFTNYRTAIIASVKYADTASMLSPYAKTFQIPTNNNQLTNGASYITAAAIAGKVNYTDTAGMLNNYLTGIIASVKYTDTASMLSNYRTGMIARVKYTDTTAMLANYLTGIIASVKYTDTAGMLNNYRTGMIARVKYTDTASMLSPYAKTFQIPTNNNQLTNGASYITAAAISGKVNYTDTAGMLNNYRTGMIASVKYTDTASMLSNYKTAIIASVKYADTATMLSHYAKTFQIPTNDNQLTNGAGYLTAETDPLYTANGVPNTRTITINGTAFDLSANRTWTIPGGGTVTSFSAGDLSPLFTSSVATATTTPAHTFTLTNAAANTYFGNATASSAAPSYTAAAALTATSDANVTIALGGNPATSLLRAASITMGWSGTLSVARGGTALGSLGSGLQLLRVNAGATALEYFTPSYLTTAVTSFSAGNLSPLFTTSVATSTSTPALTFTLTNAAANTYFGNATASSAAPSFTAAASLTATSDANVTIALGGSPTTSLLTAASITMGWSGTLSVARGGTALGSLGTGLQLLRVNAGATALEYFTPTYITANQSITLSGDVSGTGTTAITTTIGALKVTNGMLAGSIDLATKMTGVLPFANGGIGSSAATSATTGTMTVNMTTEIITITPTNACTFNASGGVAGQKVTFVVTTSGTTSFTLTWGTNFRTTATLATGTTTAKKFLISFLYDGSLWMELARTAAM